MPLKIVMIIICLFLQGYDTGLGRLYNNQKLRNMGTEDHEEPLASLYYSLFEEINLIKISLVNVVNCIERSSEVRITEFSI